MQASSNVSTLVFPRKPHIKTSHIRPPISTRSFDWSAVDDNTYDGPGSMAQPRGRLLMTYLNSLNRWGSTRGLAQGLLWTLDNDALPSNQIPHPSGCYLPREVCQQRVDVQVSQH